MSGAGGPFYPARPAAERLRLHTRYQNSAGQRARIVLNLKGIDYDYVAVDSPSSHDYLRVNPQGLMPALEIDGQMVAQSMAIIELIEELYPEPSIFPADLVTRAQARSFAHLICADLHPINNDRVRKYLAGAMGADAEAIAGWYAHWVATAFASLEEQLQRRPVQWLFCFGEMPGLADACLVPQMDNARRFGCDLSAFPLLVEIDGRCRTIAAFQDAAPERQPDYPLAKLA